MEVYTQQAAPFLMGGTHIMIKTNIEEYERVSIGNDYYGIVFKNKHKNIWHLALENCGALVGSNKSKTALIKQVTNDVLTGDPKIQKKQIEMAINQIKSAHLLSKDEWFSKFSGA